jgi:hypothetical protein
MIAATVKREAGQTCNPQIGGCGKELKEGDKVWVQKRKIIKDKSRRGSRRRYLCDECYQKHEIDVGDD